MPSFIQIALAAASPPNPPSDPAFPSAPPSEPETVMGWTPEPDFNEGWEEGELR